MKKLLIAILTIICSAQVYGQTKFHNEKADTSRINSMLIEVLKARPERPGDAVLMFANKFIGTPYKGGTLEGDEEVLQVNIDSVDCTTFVEMVMALAMTVEQRRASWLDFVYNLQNIRYRNGTIAGYPSRLHYNADWAVDNTHRGNFKEVTTFFPRYSYIVKTIDYMSANADKYKSLADSANLAGVKNTEIGYRNHRFPYIKTVDTGTKEVKAEFADGDILAFTTNVKNLDVTHMGIVVKKNGEPYVLHASSSAGKVVLSERPLNEFLKKNRNMTGVRVFRLINN